MLANVLKSIAQTFYSRNNSVDFLSARTKKKILLQYGVGEEHERMLELTRRHHQACAELWGADYYVAEPLRCTSRPPHWHRIDLILEAFKRGYDQVVWLDTDCVIVDPKTSLFDVSGFGVACCECFDSPTIERHLNTGVLVVSRSREVARFLTTWRNRPIEGVYQDQSSFINLMATRPHRDLLTILPNRFNCVETHMESRNPVILAYHGDYQRVKKIEGVMKRILMN